MRRRLSDDYIRASKGPKNGQILVWDDLVSGFGVRLTKTMKCFVVQWREKSGKKPRESLRPRFPQLTTAAARDLARKRLLQVVGNSESAAQQELRAGMRSWYERQTELGGWRPKFSTKVNGLIAHYIEGQESPRIRLSPTTRKAIHELGHKAVGSVSRENVMNVAEAIKPGAGEQLMAIGSMYYNYVYNERGVEVLNPFRGRLRVFGGRHERRRKLTEAEFLKLWHALEAESDPALACFAVLAFTGCRRREATQMRWAELDLESTTWTLPPERRKTGRRDPEPFVIHLHSHLVQMLRKQPVLERSPYVFWGRRDQRPFDFHYALIQRLQSLEIPDWRLHDVRRFVRSGMSRLGIKQAVAELCLGHVIGDPLVRTYDRHTYQEEKCDAWQKWGDYLVQLIGLR